LALMIGTILLCSLAAQAQHVRPEGDTYGYGGYGPVGHGYSAYGYPAWNAWAGYGGYPGYGAYYGRYPGYGAYYGRYPGYGYGSHFGHGGYTGQKSSTDAYGARYKRGADQKYEIRPMGSGVVNPFGQNSVGLSLSPWYAYSASAYQDYKYHAVKHSKNKYAPDRVYGSEGREKICLVLYVNRENNDPSKSDRGFVDTVHKFIRLESSSQLDNVLQNPGFVFDQFGLDFSQGGGTATCQSGPVMCWSNVEFFLVLEDFTKIIKTPQVDYTNEGCATFDNPLFNNFLCTQQINTQVGVERSGNELAITDLEAVEGGHVFQRTLIDFLDRNLLPYLVERSSQPISIATTPSNEIAIQVYLTFGGGERECTTRLFIETSDFDGAKFTFTDRNKVFTVPLRPSAELYRSKDFKFGL